MKHALMPVVSLVIASCAPKGEILTHQLQELVDLEAYAVYAVVLAEPPMTPTTEATRLVIVNETSTDGPEKCRPQPLPAQWGEVVADHDQRNTRRWRLIPGSAQIPHYDLVSRSRGIDLALRLEVGKRYPGARGVYAVSAPGFNAQKTRAVVHVVHHCGVDCGRGGYFFLEKAAGQWRTVHLSNVHMCGWISQVVGAICASARKPV